VRLPFVAVRDKVARGTLAFHPVEHDPLQTVHAITRRCGSAPAPFVTDVRNLLRDVMSNLVKTGAWAGASVIGISALTAEPGPNPVLEAAIE
jgi:hypothetical protein